MIDRLHGFATLSELCELYEVSRSGYYKHSHQSQGQRRQEDERIAERMATIFEASRETYGSPRLVEALRDQGVHCGKNRVRRLMDERGLQAKGKRKRRPRTTDSSHALPIAENLLQEEPVTIDKQWVSDITFISTREGWLYLAGVLDRFSRRVIGWATSGSQDRGLVLRAAHKAFMNRKPQPGLIYHSDRGSQYASRDCRKLLADHQAIQSMSRRANCYDNAAMESFWATLKAECFEDYIPYTHAEARTMLFDYIEVFYNRQRKHSALGYVSPEKFERDLLLLLNT